MSALIKFIDNFIPYWCKVYCIKPGHCRVSFPCVVQVFLDRIKNAKWIDLKKSSVCILKLSSFIALSFLHALTEKKVKFLSILLSFIYI